MKTFMTTDKCQANQGLKKLTVVVHTALHALRKVGVSAFAVIGALYILNKISNLDIIIM